MQKLSSFYSAYVQYFFLNKPSCEARFPCWACSVQYLSRTDWL